MKIEDKINIVNMCKNNINQAILAYLFEKVDLNLMDCKKYLELRKINSNIVNNDDEVANIVENHNATKETYSKEEMEKIIEYNQIKEDKYDFELFEAFLIGIEEGFRMSGKCDFSERIHYE